jgi:hypothetical protein
VDERENELVRRLIDRLEHLSADSIYAHRASGLRGSLLHWTDQLENNREMSREEKKQLDLLVKYGFEILELAAKEVGGRG